LIKITEKIYIKADINKIWAYLTDFTNSLNFNRFHTNLEIPNNYSLNKMETFNINHNFGFGTYNMIAEIKDCIPPNYLSISEYCLEDSQKGFPHTITFDIKQNLQKSELSYTVAGTYGGKVQDISFRPILKRVIKEELTKIKNAIESSEIAHESITSKSIKPI